MLFRSQNNIQVPDPMVQRMAADWMSRNTWYDPQMRDADSRIAQTIDQALHEEGFDASSADYWDELDDRLQKYLPHRYNSSYNPNNRNQKPRSVVTGSGREQVATTKANEFRLSPERVIALKEAGLWNNPEARKNAIRKYAEWDRQNKDTR